MISTLELLQRIDLPGARREGSVLPELLPAFALRGRLLKVEGINAGVAGTDLRGTDPWRVWAWGRLNGKSAAGDGWTIKRQNVVVSRLSRE